MNMYQLIVKLWYAGVKTAEAVMVEAACMETAMDAGKRKAKNLMRNGCLPEMHEVVWIEQTTN